MQSASKAIAVQTGLTGETRNNGGRIIMPVQRISETCSRCPRVAFKRWNVHRPHSTKYLLKHDRCKRICKSFLRGFCILV